MPEKRNKYIPLIKVCGITDINEIYAVNQLPLSYIGFVFAESKRKISIEKAIELRNALKKEIKVVGVFVDLPLNELMEILSKISLDVIQLHGNEDKDYIIKLQENFTGEIWKSISIKEAADICRINDYPEEIAILLDTYSEREKGGTGKIFDWNVVGGASEKRKIILAGGLNPENIQEAIKIVTPQIVDTSSGVETEGKKDIDKIKKFIRSVEKYGK